MSQATRVFRGPDGLLAQYCSRHGRYVVDETDGPGCPRCRENAEQRERRAAVRRSLTCNSCGTDLQTPARLCGFCDPTFDVVAALLALDHNESAGSDSSRPGARPTRSTP